MAKAALNAINGINLFGEDGSQLTTIHVDPDAQYRNYVILDTLLPKESHSKETDAALLCITGYPAFAIDDEQLRKETEQSVIDTLEVLLGGAGWGCVSLYCVALGQVWFQAFPERWSPHTEGR